MRKTYIAPSIELVESAAENSLMAASGLRDTFKNTLDSNKEYVSGDVLSKYNKNSGLWDTTWYNEDEDEDN